MAGRGLAFAFLAAIVIGGVAALDALSADPAPAHVRATGEEHAARPRGRAFVLLLDSLRYDTAVRGDLMPATARLRSRATVARIRPTRDAITVPSIRAAFSGRDSTRILGFVRNFFMTSEGGMESLFTQLAARGRRALVYSDGSFDQFGATFESRTIVTDTPDEVQQQNAATAQALAAFRSGKADLVVVHVTYTDHIAHEAGVDSPEYRATYAQADQLVARAEAAVPAGDTFVLMGDHGHDALGRHALGIDAPTFGLYRGPLHRAGVDLGTISIRDHRYLLGYALGEALPADYTAGRHPQALATATALPSDYARGGSAPQVGEGIAAPRVFGLHAMLVYLCVLFAIWLVISDCVPSLRPLPLHALSSLLVLVPSAFPSALPYNALLGIALALLWLAGLRRGARLLAGLLVLVVAGGEALYGLGAWLVQVRPLVHEPLYSTLAFAWLVMWALAIGLTRVARTPRAGWALLALPLFLAYPTVYRYGAPAAMAPSWIGWALCLLAAPALSLTSMRRGTRAKLLVTALALLALLVPFKATDALEFQFTRWHTAPLPDVPSLWFCLALFAKAVLFLLPHARAPRRVHGVALLAIGVLLLSQLDRLLPSFQFALALIAAGAAMTAHRHATRHTASPSAPGLRYITGLLALLLLQHALTRVPALAFYWQDSLLAATLLSARLVRGLPPARDREAAYALLLLLALFAAGWVTFAFTVLRLEWAFLYDFLNAQRVQDDAPWLLPLILARYLIPLLIARWLLARELSAVAPYPQRLVRILAGVKTISLLLMAAGIGSCSFASDVYLEAVQELGIVLLLVVALL